MQNIKYLYDLLPYIISVWLILNILGNTIKMTLKVKTKYIVWILLIVSILINFIFFEVSFESLFISFVTFSFSVSSYDLIKYAKVITRDYKYNVNQR